MGTLKSVDEINRDRRRFFGSAAMAVAATQFGMIDSAAARGDDPGDQPRHEHHFGPLQADRRRRAQCRVRRSRPPDGPPVILLHGWPYDIHSFVDVAPLLASAGYRVIIPYLRGYGTTRFCSGDTVRNGQPSALAVDVVETDGRARDRDARSLPGSTGERAPRTSSPRFGRSACKGMVSVSGYLIGSQEAGRMPLPPKAELQWWYQFYFATERGRAGYDKYRREFSKLIWQIASPKWKFDDATFDRSAAAFDNPDHVADRDPQLSLAAGAGRGRAAV